MIHYLTALVSLLLPLLGSAQTISTIAGIDSAGYNGDGMEATLSALNRPFSMAVNNSGNVYIADRYNSRVRRINASGVITTIAGTGTSGYTGDGGPATAAGLGYVTGVAADGAGNIYIADKSNNRVRKVGAAGIISTIAGNGMPGNSGDGGMAVAAGLNNPNGVAVDAVGNLYIADQGNSSVRKVSAAGIIITIAGTGASGYNGDGIPATAAQLYNPYAVAVDRAGNVYISDVDNERIRKVGTTGIITTIAGTGTAGVSGIGGPATAAELSEPIGVAVDSAGNVYIADAWNSRICAINTSGLLNAIAGNGTAGFSGDGGAANLAGLNLPYGVAADRSGIYVADYNNNRIRYISYSPTLVTTIAYPSLLKVYPNPSASNCMVMLTSDITEPAQVIITSALGQVVQDVTATTNKAFAVVIDVPNGAGAAALYFVSAITAHGKWREPIVIEAQK